jgi:hypothetical protein
VISGASFGTSVYKTPVTSPYGAIHLSEMEFGSPCQVETMSKLSPAQEVRLETFQQHMAAEMTGDLETSMATMADNPYVTGVPVTLV